MSAQDLTGKSAVERIGVVVPAHDEQELLPACMAAVRRAADRAGIPAHIVVVADACTDQTAAIAYAAGLHVVEICARNVGAARAAGMTELIRLTAAADLDRVWLATTDADTLVPADWLLRQLRYANQNWDLVLGTVTITDWQDYPPHVPAAYEARYGPGSRPHPHVHGANLGVRASAYLSAGGFAPLRTAEDHALFAALTEGGYAVLQASDISVVTSARRHARAPHGFSHLLRRLASQPAPGAGILP